MSQYPTLSVVMPNYNHARFLPESLDAILNQCYSPMEVIVMDDASTDNSVEVIENFVRRDPRVRLVRNERNVGVEQTVNRLLELASGEYVYSPSADDRVLPGFFEKSMRLLAQHPEAGLCSTVGRLIGEQGEDRGVRCLPVISGRPRYFSPEEVRRTLVNYGRWIDPGSVIYRLDALKREAGYVQELGSFADTFANLVLSLRYGACFVPEPLHCWRQMRMGYGSSLAADWEALLEKSLLAIRLMRTTYREVFPPEYVDQFERHRMYMVSVVAGNSAQFQAEGVLGEAFARLHGDQPSRTARAYWRMMRALLTLQARLWRFYSMARFGPWRWWIAGRLSIFLRLRKLIITEKLEA